MTHVRTRAGALSLRRCQRGCRASGRCRRRARAPLDADGSAALTAATCAEGVGQGVRRRWRRTSLVRSRRWQRQWCGHRRHRARQRVRIERARRLCALRSAFPCAWSMARMLRLPGRRVDRHAHVRSRADRAGCGHGGACELDESIFSSWSTYSEAHCLHAVAISSPSGVCMVHRVRPIASSDVVISQKAEAAVGSTPPDGRGGSE